MVYARLPYIFLDNLDNRVYNEITDTRLSRLWTETGFTYKYIQIGGMAWREKNSTR